LIDFSLLIFGDCIEWTSRPRDLKLGRVRLKLSDPPVRVWLKGLICRLKIFSNAVDVAIRTDWFCEINFDNFADRFGRY